MSILAVLPLGIAGLISWSIWLLRRTLSHRARPIDRDYSASVSVVVPVFREDPAVLSECLGTWLNEPVSEVITVVDVADAGAFAVLAACQDDRLVVIPFVHRGKRSALAAGIRAARGEITVLCDSDTAWKRGIVSELIKPFADPEVGGVGSRQLVAAAETSVWRRLASWLLDIRFLDYVPAMGARGAVPCLSGRTAAYRTSVIIHELPQMEHEIFLGRECVAGDDGRLTWLTLAAGYQTVHQSSAIAYSMFPDTGKAFFKQRIRWSRNSYRCYLTAARNGWLWDQPLITQVTVIQNLLTPLTMSIALAFLVISVLNSAWWLGLMFISWVFVGRAIRGLSHLLVQPRDIVLLPFIVFLSIAIALPIKAYAFFTMNRQGWLTRVDSKPVNEGQDSASLAGHAIAG